MRKRLTALLLIVSLLASLLPATAFAAEESGTTVVIDGDHVVKDGHAVQAMPEGVSYDEKTKTLTLNNASLGMIKIFRGSLTVVLLGDSTIYNDGRYLDPDGEAAPAFSTGEMAQDTSVTITGPGSLTVDTSGSGARRTFVADYTDLTITDDASVTVSSSDASGGVMEIVASRLILDDSASLTGRELFVSEYGSFLMDGGNLDMSGADFALHLREGGQATILDGTASLKGGAKTNVPVRCETDGVLALLGGTVHLEQQNANVLMTTDSQSSVVVGAGMSAVNNSTGAMIPIDQDFLRQIPGSSVTISGERSLGVYDCQLSIPSGLITQGARFHVRAVVSLGAEEGTVSFPLPDGVSYVPDSLTVDSQPVEPVSTKPLTVPLEGYGVVRFSAMSSRTGEMTLTANTTADGTSHQETLDFTVEGFRLSLPSETSRLEIPVSGSAVPGSTIAFYEDSTLLGRVSSNSLGTWKGTVTLPDVPGEHMVYAQVTPPGGDSFRTEAQSVYYDPAADAVKTLTVVNEVHGRTDADPPVEETLVIDFLTGQDSASYYTFWPDYPTFRFQVDFEKDASAQGSVTVVTTDRMGEETRVPLRYQAAKDAWVGSADFTEDTVPYRFRVEYTPRGQEGAESSGSYTYDEEGRVASISLDGKTLSLAYNGQDQVAEFTYGGETARYTYDQSGNLTAIEAEGYTFQVDEVSNSVTFEDGTGGTVKVEYGDQGQILAITNSDGTSSARYTYEGDAVIIKEDDGTTTRMEPISDEDAAYGATVTAPEGTSSRYTFNQLGLLLSVTDEAGLTVYYDRDDAGHVSAIRYPDGSRESFTYDSQGQIVTHTDRAGTTMSYTYDQSGNLTAVKYGNGETVTQTFDSRGNLLSITENGQKTTMTYDGSDNLTAIHSPDGSVVSYTYDAQGRRTSVSDGVYTTGYQYDSQGRVAAVTDGSSPLVTYTYDSDGRLSRQQNANGTYTQYSYSGDQLASIVHYDAAGAVLSSYAYTYDSQGHVTSLKEPAGTWRYTYDAAGQLTQATAPDGTVTTYTYDAAGNRTAKTTDGKTTNYTANSLNQYTAYGEVRRTYDQNGNVLTEQKGGQTARYTYDAQGQLTGYTDFDGTVYQYGYDAFGLRSRVTVNGETTRYVNDPLGDGYALAAYGSFGEQHYALAGMLTAARTGDEMYFYHSNLLGSVTEITDGSGAIANRYAYDQEGNVLSASGTVFNPYTYAGIYGIADDGNGLRYHRARYVSAASGSFLSPDPAYQSYDLNLYRFVYNNPVSMIDLSGAFGGEIGDVFSHESEVKGMTTQDYVDSFKKEHQAGQRLRKLNEMFGPPKEAEPAPKPNPSVQNKGTPNIQGKIQPRPTPANRFLLGGNPMGKMNLYGIALPVLIGVLQGMVDPDSHLGHMLNDPVLTLGLSLVPFVATNGYAVAGVLLGTGLLVIGREFLPILLEKLIPPKDPVMASTPDRDKTVIRDPSGYVYEGIESNRLSGVTTTLYYSAGSAKPTGNASESQRWNAADFGQQNPLTTDAQGQYLWMVPDGWWQVKYEKEGYDTVYSQWLPVPPVQTEVNVGLTSQAAAQLTLSGKAGDSSVMLRFDKPVRLSSVNTQNIQVQQGGSVLSGTLTPVDPGAAADGQLCATTFSLKLPHGQSVKSSALSVRYKDVITYAGTASSGSAQAEITESVPFTDVGTSDYYYDSVLWAVNHTPQITAGTGGTFFSPNSSCTRAQAVTFLWRAMGQPEPSGKTNPFTDVNEGDYYYKAVLWAVEKGITAGTSANTFSPGLPCTRAQIVTFLHRMEKEQAPSSTHNPFRDVTSQAYYYDAVLWAVEWGITTGTSADAFSPDLSCTRAQIVTFLYRDMA